MCGKFENEKKKRTKHFWPSGARIWTPDFPAYDLNFHERLGWQDQIYARNLKFLNFKKSKILYFFEKNIYIFFETFQDMDVQTDPDLDDFSNMYKSNNNYGEFIVSLNKINGSLGFSLRSDPEDTTALR